MNSEYRRLWLIVEGTDDRRFCNEVLLPVFQQTFDHVAIWQYSQQKLTKVASLIRSIEAMNADYLMFGDIDERPCVTSAKEYLTAQLPATVMGPSGSSPTRDRSVVSGRS